ncbi:glycosyltransferase [Carboxylicivirga sp. A043]|uniref:glycosyltransferase n=1 Tax=Carboxylicivirga litoralis TaxID=2816963 RepID=UPI0021CB5E1D|nr:glycosyltransferase [Carboxylicivirga sp. A043]MCU4157886.1 glycosyltransferase [Carboxylicivirga sp. A043]
MNILFVCSAKAWGGNEKWTSMAMQALSKKHQIFFIGKSEALLNKFGRHNRAITLPFRSYFDLVTFRKLKQFIKKHQIDLIVSTKKKEYFLCGIIAQQGGCKHLIRLGVSRKMNIPFWHQLNYKTLNDGLIVNAHYLKKELKQYPLFKEHPIHVIYNGIPGFNTKSELPVRQNHEKFIIVSSGRITKQKGYGLLIEAIAQLDESIKKQLEVRIIGEGRNKKAFEEQVKALKLEQVIHFLGFVQQPTDLMKDADLFVLLSEREGISNSILEAVTLGIPVLSTDTGGIKELIEDGKTGFLIDREITAITGKITELIHNKNTIHQVGKEAYQLLRQNFAFDVFEKNICALFNDIFK